MQYNNLEKEIQICPHCGQVVYSSKDLEKRLGTPVVYLFEQYLQWKKRKSQESETKLLQNDCNKPHNIQDEKNKGDEANEKE